MVRISRCRRETSGLVPAREGITGSGHADFEERADRTEFSVEVEDLADGNYRIIVGGSDRGPLIVNMGIGETEFRSPVEAGQMVGTIPVTMRQDGSIEGELEFRNLVEPGKILLDFDPRGQAYADFWQCSFNAIHSRKCC